MKRVFQNADQVAKIWASQSQDSARCKNAAFDGKSMCSYGAHYLLARFIEFNGVKIAAINFSKYSRTTTGQSWGAYYAAKNAGYIVVQIDSGESAHIRYDASDEEVKARVSQSLHEEGNAFLERLARLSYEAFYVDQIKDVQKDLEEFNVKVNKLCMENLVIDVPEYYFSDLLDLAKITETARKDYQKRKQEILKFNVDHEYRSFGYKENKAIQKRVS